MQFLRANGHPTLLPRLTTVTDTFEPVGMSLTI